MAPKSTLDAWLSRGTKRKATPEPEATDDFDEDDDVMKQQPAKHPKPAVEARGGVTKSPKKKTKTKSLLQSESYKKLVQRRIHISDVCRVCDCTTTEDAKRCDLKCITCEMTVHKTCYEEETPPEGDWKCRRCQLVSDTTNEEDRSVMEPPAPMKLAMGLLEPDGSRLMEDLHVRLLTNVGTSVNKSHHWSRSLLRYLKNNDFPAAAALLQDDDRDDDSPYLGLSVEERVVMLKFLCESQFDRNDSLVERLDDVDAEQLREGALGVDAAGRSYWLLEDDANAAFWLCRCAAVGGEDWETVVDSVESLAALTTSLSYSSDTNDLKLWRVLHTSVYDRLLKRQTKKERAEQRLARMPRVLGNAGLDCNAILDPSYGGRSMRTRRAVNYRLMAESSDEEEEDNKADSAADSNDDEEDDDDNSDDAAGSDEDGNTTKPRRSGRNTRLRRSPPPPTRVSRRLRNARTVTVSSGSEEEKDDDDDDDDDDNKNDDTRNKEVVELEGSDSDSDSDASG
ncbi:TPA: LOW QUALITY PROTEIN: hypothetical protein N0F65_012595 [Lagenidium giganteum]|uniref:PHD-type domain-containing protein n=1 Tax=Lagenidium giganteum TaxID=4803 RepID=A0AAV2YSF8_9STRA|nr:TPA: LOW QUALITY PROTEIN: hypothetical protein N0F65_012595 [Lagenidium giganteum]